MQTIVDTSRSFSNVHVGLAVQIYRSRTRWQRFKLWISVRILRRPHPDVFRITAVDDHVLTFDRPFDIETASTPVVIKEPPP
jgi:hypothetical protein